MNDDTVLRMAISFACIGILFAILFVGCEVQECKYKLDRIATAVSSIK